MDDNKSIPPLTFTLIVILGVAVGWCLANAYGTRFEASNRDTVVKLSRELDVMNAQLRTAIDEQVKICRSKGINVYVTEPFPIMSEGIDIETTITLKIKYLNWQIEIVIALSKISAPTPTPIPTPKPRPGGIGSVGSTEYGDSLPKGLVIGE